MTQRGWTPSLSRRAGLALGRRWKLVAWVAAILGGMFLAGIAAGVAPARWHAVWASAGFIIGAAAAAEGVIIVHLLIRQDMRLAEAYAQLSALVNVRPLAGRLPLDLGGWAADAALADEIVRYIGSRQPDLVVECGSGWSTVVIARCLRELGTGRVVAFEHSEYFAERTLRLLRSYGCADVATVVLAPLAERVIDGEIWNWYSPSVEKAIERPVDILVVDGPPGVIAPRSRYPAVPLLRGYLQDDYVVILDDGLREDETWIAKCWAEQLAADLRLVPYGRGIWVIDQVGS